MEFSYLMVRAASPCCGEPVILLKMPDDMPEHFRCRGCRALYVWISDKLSPCESPEEHTELSHVAELTPPVAPVKPGTLEKRGRGRSVAR